MYYYHLGVKLNAVDKQRLNVSYRNNVKQRNNADWPRRREKLQGNNIWRVLLLRTE